MARLSREEVKRRARLLTPQVIEALQAALENKGTTASIKAAELLMKYADFESDVPEEAPITIQLVPLEMQENGKVVALDPVLANANTA